MEHWLSQCEDAAAASTGRGGGSSTSSESSSGSSSSSSSTASSRTSSPRSEENRPAPPEALPPAGAGVRRHIHNATFEWGTHFRFTFREPSSFQVTCRQHLPEGSAACTKTASWPVGDLQAQADTILSLKLWCLRCRECNSKRAHQGGRKLPPLSAADRLLTDEHLDERLQALFPAL